MLDEFYNLKFKNLMTNKSTNSIKNEDYFIYGISGTGKSYTIYNYIKSFKDNYLYLDLKSYKLHSIDLIYEIKQFEVELLVLDNYSDDYKELLKLNITQKILISNKYIKVKNFKELEIMPLSYSEFYKYFDEKVNITNFIKSGNIISNYSNSYNFKDNNVINNLKLNLSPTLFTIMSKIIKFQSMDITLYQLYIEMKKDIKISKDTFYKNIDRLKELKYIYMVSKKNSIKGPKKIYLADFSIPDSFGLPNFYKLFENMVFCEIIKSFKNIYSIYTTTIYIEDIDTYIISEPFLDQINIVKYIDKMRYKLPSRNHYNLKVVSISSADIFVYNDMDIEILPFTDMDVICKID